MFQNFNPRVGAKRKSFIATFSSWDNGFPELAMVAVFGSLQQPQPFELVNCGLISGQLRM